MNSSEAKKPAGVKANGFIQGLLPVGFDRLGLGLLFLAFLAMYVPTYFKLGATIWPTDEQGHGPIILAVSLWLLYEKRHELAALPAPAFSLMGWGLLGFSCILYAIGHSQDLLFFEAGSKIVLLTALALIFKGVPGLKLIWFPLFFLLFMVPLPENLVAAVTAPLKTAVSYVASGLLYQLGYPIGRSGVTLTVGQYQLLVADACAGLNSMFTLEALGLLYMNLMKYKSFARNISLAILIIPISFCANIIRVMVLVLVTYYFGDEAGQGFAHGFAGMVLFLVALTLILSVDGLLGLVFKEKKLP
ncbi:exosortase B [Roseateles albus]|uniref:Exosortase B n=1 Tax=Roseateles albus TaxID=2987525 RepID=A0ABT5KDS0_9BURK|nr:exosortase B [Roseateles albus]MDC8772072.1 exosortase B [Roseateles albus]